MSGSPEAVIRPYRAADRADVRRLACETAVRGTPVDTLFADREVAADVLTRYYTDEEPSSVFVAESDGRVVGYLTGCLDSRRYARRMTWRIVPAAVLRAVRHGMLWHASTRRLLQAGWLTWRRGGLPRTFTAPAYPAHLHLNVQEGFRGQRIGQSLTERFLQQAASAGVPGVHAAVRGDNAPACRLFERLGFTVLSRHPMVLPAGNAFHVHETVMYGKRL